MLRSIEKTTKQSGFTFGKETLVHEGFSCVFACKAIMSKSFSVFATTNDSPFASLLRFRQVTAENILMFDQLVCSGPIFFPCLPVSIRNTEAMLCPGTYGTSHRTRLCPEDITPAYWNRCVRATLNSSFSFDKASSCKVTC